MRKYTSLIVCVVVSQSLFAQWSGSTTTTGSINRQGKVILNSTGWDSHLEISRNGYGGAFKPDNSSGYKGLRLDLTGSGSSFYVMNGNVGIGIVNPTNTLHVQGSTHFGVSSGLPSDATANNSSNYVEKYGLKMTSSNNGFYISLSTSVNERKVYLQSGHESSTYAYGVGPICINPFGGDVGIGSTNPDSKLTVKGTVHAEEVKVDLSVPGPDYVFDESYPLQSLEEIESYVKRNKHLPDVPSAKQMEDEGIKVGEMNMILLRKIEEMTLHLIRQNEQMAQLKEESRASADSSARKIEEMTLHMIEMKKEIQRLKETKN